MQAWQTDAVVKIWLTVINRTVIVFKGLLSDLSIDFPYYGGWIRDKGVITNRHKQVCLITMPCLTQGVQGRR